MCVQLDDKIIFGYGIIGTLKKKNMHRMTLGLKIYLARSTQKITSITVIVQYTWHM